MITYFYLVISVPVRFAQPLPGINTPGLGTPLCYTITISRNIYKSNITKSYNDK